MHPLISFNADEGLFQVKADLANLRSKMTASTNAPAMTPRMLFGTRIGGVVFLSLMSWTPMIWERS